MKGSGWHFLGKKNRDGQSNWLALLATAFPADRNGSAALEYHSCLGNRQRCHPSHVHLIGIPTGRTTSSLLTGQRSELQTLPALTY
jgi:hypothetical protein